VMRTLGGALGGQLSATFVAAHTAGGHPTVTGFSESFFIATGVLLVCLLAGALVPRRAAPTQRAGGREEASVETAERQTAGV
ncbi:MAG: hypothetical protein QOE67_746, partial [Solirubrobacteraceae bacterium]|nr:hypothetical protein [Solirubrobacteraceae bacterium]